MAGSERELGRGSSLSQEKLLLGSWQVWGGGRWEVVSLLFL